MDSEAEAKYHIKQVLPGEVDLVYELLSLFADVFDENETYRHNQPDRDYLIRHLENDSFLVVVALFGSKVVGGLTVFELTKFEQERKELFIYDLAVHENHRRRGVATSMIDKVKSLASERGSYMVFIQSEAEDEPSSMTYRQFSDPLKVFHFEFRPDSLRDV